MRELRQEPMPTVGTDSKYALVGASVQMQQLRSQILKTARVDAPVLISGHSGSGKEVAALAIHRQSARAQGPFVAIHCGAIPPQRLQAELFGQGNGDGRVHDAHGGTLFLDAVGDLAQDAQAGLLRFLSEQAAAVRNGVAPAIDVRVMSATRCDLAEAVRQGRFREDLYYRLNVMCLSTPNLANRGQDIEAIARHYFAKFASTHNRSLRGFAKAAMNAMLTHAWPGNVRELINRVQRATVMAEGRFIQPEDLGLERPQDHAQLLSLEDARAAAECAMIRRALAQSRNQISRAASLLGVSRVTLYRLIEKYNIRPEGAPMVRASFLAAHKADGEARN
jgi:DNA-binding NtrC family response regulator